jgi:hypothetical protein
MIALWIISTFLIPLTGVGLGICFDNQGFLLLCFAPVLWTLL